MTSYSLYGVDRIRYVDGDLSTEDDQREDQMWQVTNCLLAGAARGLLDQVLDLDTADERSAVEWHSPVEGWESAAVVDGDLPALRAFVERFAAENLTSVIALAEFIAWGPGQSGVWAGSSGMGMYRVGYLLGMEGAGQGMGFRDVPMPVVPDRLSAWLDRQGGGHPWEGSYVLGTEDPCLLHLH